MKKNRPETVASGLFAGAAPEVGKSVVVRKLAQPAGQAAPDCIGCAYCRACEDQPPKYLVDPVSRHYAFQTIHHIGGDGKDHCRRQSE